MDRYASASQPIGRQGTRLDGLTAEEWFSHGGSVALGSDKDAEREPTAKNQATSRSEFTLGEEGWDS
jgi:hypothetical protein